MPPINTNQINITQIKQDGQVLLNASHKRLMATFSYLSILFWVPIFISKDDEFVKFHIKQGFVLFIVEVITGMFTFFSTQIWLEIVVSLLLLVWLVLSIIGIKNVIKGKEVALPIIGKVVSKINFPHMRI